MCVEKQMLFVYKEGRLGVAAIPSAANVHLLKGWSSKDFYVKELVFLQFCILGFIKNGDRSCISSPYFFFYLKTLRILGTYYKSRSILPIEAIHFHLNSVGLSYKGHLIIKVRFSKHNTTLKFPCVPILLLLEIHSAYLWSIWEWSMHLISKWQ